MEHDKTWALGTMVRFSFGTRIIKEFLDVLFSGRGAVLSRACTHIRRYCPSHCPSPRKWDIQKFFDDSSFKFEPKYHAYCSYFLMFDHLTVHVGALSRDFKLFSEFWVFSSFFLLLNRWLATISTCWKVFRFVMYMTWYGEGEIQFTFCFLYFYSNVMCLVRCLCLSPY
jgi:hypothetical protein